MSGRPPRSTAPQALEYVEHALSATDAPFFLDAFSVVDCVFTPYVESTALSTSFLGHFSRDSRPKAAMHAA